MDMQVRYICRYQGIYCLVMLIYFYTDFEYLIVLSLNFFQLCLKFINIV